MTTALPAIPAIRSDADAAAIDTGRQALFDAIAALDFARAVAEDDRVVEALDIASALLDEQAGDLYCLAHTIYDDEADARSAARADWFTPYRNAA
jgi:hypothetical protein